LPNTQKPRPRAGGEKVFFFIWGGVWGGGAAVLDLFAGSGGLGLEALSRSAREVTFVEKGPWALRSIRENLRRLGVEGKARLLHRDVFRALRTLEREGQTFGLIFLDPPYNKGVVKKILLLLDQSDIVTPLTQLILHRSRQEKLPDNLEKLELFREKQVGQACLSFFTRRK